MPVDPLDYLNSKYAEIGQEIPSSLKELEGSKISDITIGDEEQRTHAVQPLGLDNLKDYEGYVDLTNANLLSQDINKLRAEEQGGIAQGFNAIVGGVASGLATAVEDASYILDLDNHIKWLQGEDTNERNWLAEAMVSTKEAIGEALPIYRTSDETFDWGDSGFYWSSLKGIIDSAVGFGLPGGAIAKGSSALLKAARVSKYIELAGGAGAVRGAEALLAGGIQNYAEGKIMALETYDNTMESLSGLVDTGKITLQEAQARAGQAADEMLLHNRAMILTDAFSLHGLGRITAGTRNLLKERGFKNRVKDFGKSLIVPNSENIVLQGVKEAGEEITQNVIQMEAQYQAEKAAGKDVSDKPEDTLERLYGYATSDQALLEGMMGFFGGGPQRILSEVTSGRLTKSAKEEYKARYDAQQEAIATNATFTEDIIKNDSKRFAERDVLRGKGEDVLADAVEGEVIDNMIIKNLALGTTEDLESKAQEIVNNPEATEEAKQSSNLILERLNDLEKEYIKNADKVNVAQIISNRSKKRLGNKFLEDINEKISDKQSELEEVINTIIVPRLEKTSKIKDKELASAKFSYDIDNLEKNPFNSKTEPQAFSQYNKFINRVKKEGALNELKDLKESRDKIIDNLETVQQEYNNLKSEEGQKKALKEREQTLKAQEKKNNVRKETIPSKTETINPIQDKVYEDNKGALYKFLGIDQDGDYLFKPVDGKLSGKILSREEFVNNFIKEGSLTARVDEQEAESKNKEEEAIKNNISIVEKETKTNEEEIISKSPIVNPVNISDVEPSNETQVTPETTLKRSSNPQSLAWVSTNNPKTTGGNNDITEYLENPNNDIVGNRIKIELDRELTNTKDFNSFIEGDKSDELLSRLIQSGSIKVTILDKFGSPITKNNTEISLYIHLPSFAQSQRPGYEQEMGLLREDILNKLSDSNNILFSTIESKGPGTIQKGTEEQNLKVVTGKENSKDIELSIRYLDGELYTGPIEDGPAIHLKGSSKPSAPKGTVFATIPMANGELFPMRLNISTVTTDEARLITNIYEGILDKRFNYQTILSNETASDINELIEGSDRLKNLTNAIIKSNDDYYSIDDITLGELLDNLVYAGSKSANGTYPLILNEKDGEVIYGSNKITLDELKEDPFNFMKWLTENKIRNIKFRKINNVPYKNYLIDNNIIQSNNLYNEKGVIFAQPTITFKNEFTDIPLEKSEGIPEEMQETDKNMVEEAYTGSSIIEDLNKKAEQAKKDKEDINKIDAVSHQIAITAGEINRFTEEMISKYGKEAIDNAGSFKSTYDSMAKAMGDNDNTFMLAKLEYENQVENCL